MQDYRPRFAIPREYASTALNGDRGLSCFGLHGSRLDNLVTGTWTQR